MAKRWLTSWLFVLFAIGCAVGQSDLGAKAVPEQNNGKDYAGRPVENASVPQGRVLDTVEKQMVEQSVREIHFGYDRCVITLLQRGVFNDVAELLTETSNRFMHIVS